MLVTPGNLRIVYAIRFATVGFSALALFMKAGSNPSQNDLDIYIIMLAVLLLLSQSATAVTAENYLKDPDITRYHLSKLDVFVVYACCILIICARDIFDVHIYNIITLLSGIIALISGFFWNNYYISEGRQCSVRYSGLP